MLIQVRADEQRPSAAIQRFRCACRVHEKPKSPQSLSCYDTRRSIVQKTKNVVGILLEGLAVVGCDANSYDERESDQLSWYLDQDSAWLLTTP